MRYDRLTRLVRFEVGGEEYAARLTNGMLEQIENACDGGSLLDEINRGVPKLKVLRTAFSISLTKEGEKVKNGLAVYEKFLDEQGIDVVSNTFFAMVAASYYLGPKHSNKVLEGLGLIVKDKEPIEEEQGKNA